MIQPRHILRRVEGSVGPITLNRPRALRDPGRSMIAAVQAIEMQAQAQAILRQSRAFRRAHEAFAAKREPAFEGATEVQKLVIARELLR